ncbi:MFS transporter [Pantoea anthophila]|uniref:MFS transporter n=1 Tax=Pantoea anthophila TaxID=470931 RepID=UPI0028971305|nr:MFS transporter [Pantoea anthophila]
MTLSPPQDGLPGAQRYMAIITIALGLTMAVLDGAIANVALPTISRELNASPAQSIWIVNAYQIAIIVSLLSLSFLGDMLGYRRVYQTGLALFIVTSVFCAFSTSLTMLTCARVLQGLGGAALMSVNTALIRIIYPQRYLGRGMAIPLGAVALWLALRTLPDNPQKATTQKFDVPSAIMNALFFGLIISALSGFAQGQSHLLVLSEVIGLLVVGWFFIRRQLAMTVPLLPVDLLRIPIFSLSMGTSVCSFCAQMLAMVSLPFFLQNVLQRDEVATGLLLTPWPLATMVFAPIAGRLIGRVHAGLLGGIGLAMFALGLFLLAWLPANPGDGDIIWRMMLCGAGFGLFQSPNNHTIVTSAPRHRSGGASGMLGTARLLGQSAGAALVALMFNLFDEQGTHASLLLAGSFAAVAALVSVSRMTQNRA